MEEIAPDSEEERNPGYDKDVTSSEWERGENGQKRFLGRRDGTPDIGRREKTSDMGRYKETSADYYYYIQVDYDHDHDFGYLTDLLGMESNFEFSEATLEEMDLRLQGDRDDISDVCGG